MNIASRRCDRDISDYCTIFLVFFSIPRSSSSMILFLALCSRLSQADFVSKFSAQKSELLDNGSSKNHWSSKTIFRASSIYLRPVYPARRARAYPFGQRAGVHRQGGPGVNHRGGSPDCRKAPSIFWAPTRSLPRGLQARARRDQVSCSKGTFFPHQS